MNTYIVIAAYNEAKRLGQVLGELKKSGYEKIIVIDDGSTDSTYDVAKKTKVQVLRHFINRGQGAALQTGIRFALSRGADIIVTFDADGQFLVSDIEKIIKPIQEHKVDITLGSRFMGKAINIPLLKKLVLWLGVFVVYLFYGIRVSDSQCGFRGMSKHAAQKIRISSDRMEHAAEIFSEIMRNNLKYKEIPITVVYDDYSLGKGQDWSRSLDLGFKMLLKKLR